MFSAEMPLGMPSQPLTTAPPRFQMLRTLLSRTAIPLIEFCWPEHRTGIIDCQRFCPNGTNFLSRKAIVRCGNGFIGPRRRVSVQSEAKLSDKFRRPSGINVATRNSA
jgi:hypothetical protein